MARKSKKTWPESYYSEEKQTERFLLHNMSSTLRNHEKGIQKILEIVQGRDTGSEKLQWKDRREFWEINERRF